MTLRTNILFYLLIKFLKPDLVCDIGSLNGRNSIRFRRFSPCSKVIAFEANPYNVKSMMGNDQIRNNNIYVEHKAVSNKDEEAVFHIERIANVGFKNGVSSLRERVENITGGEEAKVTVVRLDNYIRSQSAVHNSIALWIDVEGMCYEALEGIKDIKESVCVIHIEVETQAFWKGQKLKKEVEALLEDLGFKFLGRGMPEEQHDLVYINKKIYDRSPFKLKCILLVAYLCSYAQSIINFVRIRK